MVLEANNETVYERGGVITIMGVFWGVANE